jgi:bacterioferritin-associated ferredoxin
VQPDDTICYCFHVSKRKILNFIRIHEPRVASQISECGGAGTGCGWCIPFLEKYFKQAAARTSDPGAGSVRVASPEADDLTPDEYARQRGEYIRSGKGVPPPGAIPPPGPST